MIKHTKIPAVFLAAVSSLAVSGGAFAGDAVPGWSMPGDTPEKLADPAGLREKVERLQQIDHWTKFATPEQIALFEGPETEWEKIPMSAYDLSAVDKSMIGSKVPKPGVHPRVLFSPEDVPAIKRRLENSPEWIATGVILEKTLLDPQTDDGKVFAKLASGDLEGLTFPNDGNQGSNGHHLFKEFPKIGVYAAHVPYWPRNLHTIGFYALITGDQELGKKAANALVNYYKLREPLIDMQIARAKDPNAEDAMPGDLWRGMHWVAGEGHLGLAYDMTAMHMDEEQKKTMRRIINKALGGKRSYGANGPVRWRDTNWVGWDTQHGLVNLAIEGEDGYDPAITENLRDTVYGYLTHGISSQGTIFETNGKNGAGFHYAMASLVATARRGSEHLLAHPHLRKLAASQMQQVVPAGDRNNNNGTYGCAPFGQGAFLQSLYPGDKAARWMVHEGKKSDTPADLAAYREQLRSKPVNRIHPLTSTAWMFAGSSQAPQDKEAWERDWVGLPLDFEDSHHGQMTTRSGNDKDALYLMTECRPDLYTGGHQHYDAGHFYLSADGVNWGVEGSNGLRSSKFHSLVLIDGEGQGDNNDFAPARGDWLGVVSNENGAFTRMDQKHPYGYNWAIPPHYAWETPARKARQWEPETHPEVVKCFKGTQHAKCRIWAGSYWNSEWGPTMRTVQNPVQKAFRTAGIVRGERPYALIVDDIRKDDTVRLYEWQMQLPEGVTTAQFHRMPPGATILVREEDLEANGKSPKAGAPCLSVLVLQKESDFSGNLANAFPDEIRQALPGKTNRLVISTKAVEPKFKIALVPFRFGEPVPTATTQDGRTEITWASFDPKTKQDTVHARDEISFAEGPSGRTGFTVARNGSPLIQVD